ncbi:MAG: hypothetical protein D3914_06765 [Candidatus Electrothrix sp. LOE2]|jgi:hypothetical protein|nr:hypothetical protein [Candidatus Electrothrix sp. LOE2]
MPFSYPVLKHRAIFGLSLRDAVSRMPQPRQGRSRIAHRFNGGCLDRNVEKSNPERGQHTDPKVTSWEEEKDI